MVKNFEIVDHVAAEDRLADAYCLGRYDLSNLESLHGLYLQIEKDIADPMTREFIHRGIREAILDRAVTAGMPVSLYIPFEFTQRIDLDMLQELTDEWADRLLAEDPPDLEILLLSNKSTGRGREKQKEKSATTKQSNEGDK